MILVPRLALALGILAGLWLAAAWLAAWQRRRLDMPGLESTERPVLLLITASRCGACTAQKHVIECLVAEWGEVGPTVVQVDAEQEVERVRRLAVMTVPSTVLLAPDGTVAAINNGFASLAVLSEQWSRLQTNIK